MDTINLLTNVSIAALLILVFYLLARQAFPILDRMASALTKHLAGMDASQRNVADTLEDIRIALETDMRLRGHDPIPRKRDRQPPNDDTA